MQGEKTSHRGIRKLGDTEFIVRARVSDGETQHDRYVRVSGNIDDAVRAREQLLEDLRAHANFAKKRRARGLTAENLANETVTDYAGRWLQHLLRSGRNRPHVVDQHLNVLERFILPPLGAIKLRKLTRLDIVAWMDGLGDLTHDGQQYAKLTLNGVWATLRAMLKDALVLAELPADLTAGIRFRVRGLEPAEKDVLTRDELARVLEETQYESADMRTMIWVGFTTGMRFGELSALQWSDVDFGAGLIHVRKSQVKGQVGPTKTRRRRTVPLHSVVANVLQEHRKWQEERLMSCDATSFLFPATKPHGGAAGPPRLRFSNVMTKPLSRCAERAGVKKHVTSHTMRRTFNNLARQVAGEIVARSMTGHTSTAMTEHYSHISIEEKSKAVIAALGLPPRSAEHQVVRLDIDGARGEAQRRPRKKRESRPMVDRFGLHSALTNAVDPPK